MASLGTALDPCRAVWSEALRIRPRSLAETLLWELATYHRLSREVVLHRCRTAGQRIAEAWWSADPRTPADVEAFYRQPLDYPFELLWWHSFRAGDRNFLNAVPALRVVRERGAATALDFGGGVGSHAMVMAAMGLQPTVADVSDDMLTFAAWRAQQRGHAIRTLHLGRDTLRGPYDLIVAADVLEHLPSPAETLMWLCTFLPSGGHIFINMPAGPSPGVPQHISFWGEQLVIDRGLRETIRYGAVAVLLEKVGEVRAHGTPPHFGQPRSSARPALIPPISPGLWWAQTRAWYRGR